jgi:hypothetical protein
MHPLCRCHTARFPSLRGSDVTLRYLVPKYSAPLSKRIAMPRQQPVESDEVEPARPSQQLVRFFRLEREWDPESLARYTVVRYWRVEVHAPPQMRP